MRRSAPASSTSCRRRPVYPAPPGARGALARDLRWSWSCAMTERRAEQSMRERRVLPDVSAAVVESLGDAVVIAFPDGQLRMNPVAREAFGVADGDRPERATFRAGVELAAEDRRVVPAGQAPVGRALPGARA